MDEHEHKEQFEATDYDGKGNIKLPPPPLEAAKKKRITVAELNKAIDDIRDVKFPETLDWLGELATRLDKIEEFNMHSAKAFELLLSNFEERNKQIDELMQSKATVDIKEPAATPQPAETEIEFAQPPQQRAGVSTSKGDIETVASVCQSLGDVLMICRALKANPDLKDEDRNYILRLACGQAGETLTPGLQIRAGVRSVEA